MSTSTDWNATFTGSSTPGDGWSLLLGPYNFVGSPPEVTTGTPELIYLGSGNWQAGDGNELYDFDNPASVVFDVPLGNTSPIIAATIQIAFGALPTGGDFAGIRIGDHDAANGLMAGVSSTQIELRDTADVVLVTAPMPDLFGNTNIAFIANVDTGYMALWVGDAFVGEATTTNLPAGTLYMSLSGYGESSPPAATVFHQPTAMEYPDTGGDPPAVIRNLAINPSAEQSYDRAWTASNGTIETNVVWEV